MQYPQMEANKILFRCSSLGYIMTEPQGKTPFQIWEEASVKIVKLMNQYNAVSNKETKSAIALKKRLDTAIALQSEAAKNKDGVFLSESCKTHLIDKFVSVKYGRETDITNRYTAKGLMVEEDSITIYSRFKGEFYKKNEERLENEFICGTPDLYEGENIKAATRVIDLKSSWDIFTFFRTTAKPLNAMHYWQLQGYMALTGAQTATLAYCLTDTPAPLVNDEKRNLLRKMGVATDQNPDFIEACKEIDRLSCYSDVPLKERVLETVIPRNDEDIERLYKRVTQCREYLNQLLNVHPR